MSARRRALAAVVCGVGLSACGLGSPTAQPATALRSAAASATSASAAEAEAPTPTFVEVPTIGVRAELVELGLNDDGSLEVPKVFSQAGWWTGGHEPGERGAAVIVGHVDSYRGPAVFFRLRDLARGDEIIVHRRGGSTVSYLVDRIEQHDKGAFPTDAVYGETDEIELRLVTCGGDFDRQARSYRDNLIVFATAAARRSASSPGR
ncbi:MAG: class F sortase [Egibacteraceae bacterium]